MTYPPGYPQAPGYPPQRATPPGVAVGAAISALVSGNILLYLVVDALIMFGDLGFGHLPAELYVILGWQLLAGLFLVLGGVLTIARKSSGPVLAVIGAVGALSAVLAEPLILRLDFGRFFDSIFNFGHLRSILVVVALVEAASALVFALMPATRQWVRVTPPAPAGYLPGGHHPGW
ncbi:hypothetical protein [Actinokineospora xionganensis]|uniref:Uncharacterized protein n=1 Tax=Actinokineospora xionganensis TaxID=2684470 RepID=A0ABR7LCQ9_9PSEU|nr:hypothetical protein [Actinokineospora xionganensis]MBC6450342.1 hypothetical protein [Actinokineospora xionganensis]